MAVHKINIRTIWELSGTIRDNIVYQNTYGSSTLPVRRNDMLIEGEGLTYLVNESIRNMILHGRDTIIPPMIEDIRWMDIHYTDIALYEKCMYSTDFYKNFYKNAKKHSTTL